MIELRWVELHSPLFFGGKNHGMKLDAKTGMRLVYDEDKERLIVIWKDDATIIPFAGTTHNAWPKDPKAFIASLNLPALELEPAKPLKAHTPKMTAQVDTPQSHVFAGHGAGKSR